MKKISKRKKPGSIVEIKLNDGSYCYGRALTEPLMAFYSINSKTPITEIEQILKEDVLFKIWVMKYATTSGRWPIIGYKDLEDGLKSPVVFFKQDSLTKKLYLYVNGKDIPASFNECEGLEYAAVWEPEHVEDRLRDYFNNVPNVWVEQLKANPLSN